MLISYYVLTNLRVKPCREQTEFLWSLTLGAVKSILWPSLLSWFWCFISAANYILYWSLFATSPNHFGYCHQTNYSILCSNLARLDIVNILCRSLFWNSFISILDTVTRRTVVFIITNSPNRILLKSTSRFRPYFIELVLDTVTRRTIEFITTIPSIQIGLEFSESTTLEDLLRLLLDNSSDSCYSQWRQRAAKCRDFARKSELHSIQALWHSETSVLLSIALADCAQEGQYRNCKYCKYKKL